MSSSAKQKSLVDIEIYQRGAPIICLLMERACAEAGRGAGGDLETQETGEKAGFPCRFPYLLVE